MVLALEKNFESRMDCVLYTIGFVTPCNFSCNLQRNSTLGKCKIAKYVFPSQVCNIFLTHQTLVTNLHILRVELRCKLQEKLHHVTEPYGFAEFSGIDLPNSVV